MLKQSSEFIVAVKGILKVCELDLISQAAVFGIKLSLHKRIFHSSPNVL